MFKNTLIAVLVGALSWATAACAVEEVEGIGQAEGSVASCDEPVSPSVRSLLDWAGVVSYERLRAFMPSDAARNISEQGPYDCLEDLASVPRVGNEALRRLVDWGQYYGDVSSSLYAVIDQPTSGEYDAVVAFDVDDDDQTTAFANGATLDELDAVPGIGPATAGKIIAARPLADVRALYAVSGIGVTRLRVLMEASVGWEGGAPEPEPDPVITYEWNLGVLDPVLAALIVGELHDVAYANRDPGAPAPVVFAEVEIHSVAGVPVLYKVLYLQMLDAEGGIQLGISLTLDADFALQDVVLYI